MKIFIARGYHLASLAVPAKLVYSIFLVFIGLGIWTSWAIYAERIGGSLEAPPGQPSVQERYTERGAEPPAASAGSAAGPSLDLPDDEPEPATASTADLKWPWILDVFHQHLFTIGVVFLILAHLFMLTRLHPILASVIIATAGLSALVHVLAPVIIHTTGGALWLMPVTGAAMGLSWSAMVAWTFLAMWTGWGSARAGARADAASTT